jgi:nicotinic acid mononucleotide adenylyltransferase
LLDVSSSHARERASRGEPLSGLLGAPVADYVAAHGLYREGARTG